MILFVSNSQPPVVTSVFLFQLAGFLALGRNHGRIGAFDADTKNEGRIQRMTFFSKCALAAVTSLSFAMPALAQKAAAPTAAKSTPLAVDPSKSKIAWSGSRKVAGGHNGEIMLLSGTVSMGEKTLTGGELVIDMKSIVVTDIPVTDENNGKLKGHLSGADFFDVEKYPTSKLVVTSAKALGGGKHQVKGKMTIKDVTQDVSFPLEVKKTGEETQATGKLKVDRTKYGVQHGSSNFFKLAADKVINNDMELEFTVVAK